MSDLNNFGKWIEDIKREISRLKSGAFLENSSISYGRMRFIGGLLLIDSGGTLQVVGHLNGDGDFVWSGPWAFTGEGEITGDVALTGNLDVVDDGRITVGSIEIRDGKIYVGTGGSQIVIDGATGKITAGNLTIDPSSNGGSIKFAGGPEVYAAGGQLGLYSTITGGYVTLDDGAGELHGPGVAKVSVSDTQIFLQGATPISVTASGGHLPGAYVRLAGGALGYVVPD